MKNTPFNLAESVFELFSDPGLSGLPHWRIEPGEGHGLRVSQRWCLAQFEWTGKPAEGPALRMTRDFAVDCSAYDTLMISMVGPEKSVLRMEVATDRGVIHYESEPFGMLKRECYVPLEGAADIRSVTLEMWPDADGLGIGWFNWIGLQHKELVERYEAQWRRFDETWEDYLLPESYEPTFEPSYGLVVNASELAELRTKHEAWVTERGTSPFLQLADDAAKLSPENMIGEYVNFWNDTRYCRDRDYGKLLLMHGPNAAAAALLTKNKALHRLAARYAISLAMCERWDSGFICYFPGSSFEHRPFVQSLCMLETAALLDMCGEWFTDYGRQLVLRRIAEDGQGNTNFGVWKHEYIFSCNQLAWFTPGRMLGYAMLEQTMPRVKPYTELAVADLTESMEKTILPDGGFLEGPMYFAWTARQCAVSLYYYARLRNLDFASVVPECLKRSSAFAEVLESTADDVLMMLICDAMYINQESLAYLAALMPDSRWVDLFRKSLRLTGGIPDTLPAYLLSASLPETGPEPRAFVSLPEMGLMSSFRRYHGEPVKLMLMGNQAGANHTHEDKGHFVLEFAGDTYAMEPGSCDYSHPMAEILKHAQRHNMLVPVGMEERPRPQNPIPHDIKPQGTGDVTAFHASVDVTPGWDGYYRKWQRRWDSPAPNELTMTDEYELERGTGVEFYWSTLVPAAIVDGEIVLRGKRSLARIAVPEGCTARIDKLPLLGDDYRAILEQRKEMLCGNMPLIGSEQTRIAICMPGASGTLQVKVRLELV
ncbi:heparinase II/III family protein [Paenibacillus cymbidii]|uniref:heparinase II/III family protein n=1 Tax=Paenibacillus cymbidii TaxID=1639034 RepID=UPI001436B250|nr:heparinase II/III family protein [Paenibacillus cymbidii]